MVAALLLAKVGSSSAVPSFRHCRAEFVAPFCAQLSSRRWFAAAAGVIDPMRIRMDNVSTKRKEENEAVQRRKKKVYALAEFFDRPDNWGKQGTLDPSDRPGRSWTPDELRLKSNTDLHKLWYVLLKERNMLLTMDNAYKVRFLNMPNPDRIDQVKESMDHIEAIAHERNDAFLQLETGDSASPPKRTITSFMGFTYKEDATEHYLPAAETDEKQYEVPMLDEQAHLMQVLWREKEHIKEEVVLMDEYLFMDPERDERNDLLLTRPKRRYINRVEDLPQNVVARWRKEREEFQPPADPYSNE